MTPDFFQEQFQKGWELRNQGKYEEVLDLADANLILTREADDAASEALFLKLHAQTHADQGNLTDAFSCYKRIEKIYIDLEDLPGQMHTLRHIGGLYLDLKEFECAEKCLLQVVEAYAQNPPKALETANTHRSYALALRA